MATRTDITAKLPGSLTPRQARDARARAWAYVSNASTTTQRRSPLAGAAPTTEPRSRRIPPINIVAHEPDLLPKVRELYSRRPESRFREAWELQHLLFSLDYSNGLVPETEIAAAVEVARADWMPDEGAS